MTQSSRCTGRTKAGKNIKREMKVNYSSLMGETLPQHNRIPLPVRLTDTRCHSNHSCGRKPGLALNTSSSRPGDPYEPLPCVRYSGSMPPQPSALHQRLPAMPSLPQTSHGRQSSGNRFSRVSEPSQVTQGHQCWIAKATALGNHAHLSQDTKRQLLPGRRPAFVPISRRRQCLS